MAVDGGDDRFVALFDSMILWGSDNWPRIDRKLFENSRLDRGGFDEKLFQELGIDRDSAIPEKLRPHVAAGIQRAIENAVIRLAGDAKDLPGRRPRDERAARFGPGAARDKYSCSRRRETRVQQSGQSCNCWRLCLGRRRCELCAIFAWALSIRRRRSSRYSRTANCDSNIC